MPKPFLRTVTDTDALAAEAAEFIAACMQEAISERSACVLGLAGGSTPRAAYELLGQDKTIDWSAVWIFLVDDRHVRRDSPKSNHHLLRQTILRHAPIPESQILTPDPDLPPTESALSYGELLSGLVHRRGIDLLVLGMGEDGHIASLFPPLGPEAMSDTGAIHTTTDQFDIRDRISATLPILTAAREALFLLSGAAKRRTWKEMTAAAYDPVRWPAHAVLETMPTTVLIAE
jgi:6-phosphogluconolactonase